MAAKKVEFVGFAHTATYNGYDPGLQREHKSVAAGAVLTVSDAKADRLIEDFKEAGPNKRPAFRVTADKVPDAEAPKGSDIQRDTKRKPA